MAKDNRQDFTLLYQLIRGIVFMGTPHRGSGAASLGSLCAAIAKSVGVSTNSRLVTSLKQDSDELTELSSDFRNCSEHLKMLSFYELDRTSRFMKKPVSTPPVAQGVYYMSPETNTEQIVPKGSATLDRLNERTFGLQRNHQNIVKFSSAQSMACQGVMKEIKQLAREVLDERVTQGEFVRTT
jgi:hypothetical protein